VAAPADARVDDLWMFRLANTIADRYTDSGAVCVSNMRLVTPKDHETPIAIAA
jgi:hypothetical protein